MASQNRDRRRLVSTIRAMQGQNRLTVRRARQGKAASGSIPGRARYGKATSGPIPGTARQGKAASGSIPGRERHGKATSGPVLGRARQGKAAVSAQLCLRQPRLRDASA